MRTVEKEAAFLEFLEAFPHHGLDARLAKIAEERDALAADLDRPMLAKALAAKPPVVRLRGRLIVRRNAPPPA